MMAAAEASLAEGELLRHVEKKQSIISEISMRHKKAESFQKGREDDSDDDDDDDDDDSHNLIDLGCEEMNTF